MSWLNILWKFSRPHTIIGTTLSVFCLYILALVFTDNFFNYINSIILIKAWITCLLGNVYIVGLNQLIDIEIDKINKPNLPLASGKLSLIQGQFIVIISGLVAIICAWFFGQWLFATVAVSLIIGTAYSLPPIRLKRFPFLASLCIFTVRGVIVNVGLFFHFTQQFTGKYFINFPIYILTLFIVIFTIAIAIFKDVPDLEGDKKYNINTFTILLGKETIFNIARWVITFCYLGIIITGYYFNFPQLNYFSLIIIHLILLILLWWRSQKVNLEEKSEIASFYQFIWKLFFLEYLLFPSLFLI